MNILVTGGAGYIGSHTLVELLSAGHEVTVLDNLSTGYFEAIDRAEKITGKDIISFIFRSVCDSTMYTHMNFNEFDAVIHFAGLKSIEQSLLYPEAYYYTNVYGTYRLCKVMKFANISKIIFSSSAAIYGQPKTLPIKEDAPLKPLNPYGFTKKTCEELIYWMAKANNWDATILRYFNPVGAHPSGLIGEVTTNTANLMPNIIKVAAGLKDKIIVNGNDYPNTTDGTCMRDYIHVVDLAKAHVAALKNQKKGVSIYNIGCGRGYSVLELINAVSTASGKEIKYEVGNRRSGDAEKIWADPSLANKELNWHSELSINDMAQSAWNWYLKNPNNYN